MEALVASPSVGCGYSPLNQERKGREGGARKGLQGKSDSSKCPAGVHKVDLGHQHVSPTLKPAPSLPRIHPITEVLKRSPCWGAPSGSLVNVSRLLASDPTRGLGRRHMAL